MSISISNERGDSTIITLIGHLDASTSTHYESEALNAISASSVPIVVDLSKVSYISSEGLRLFIVMAKAAKAKQLAIIFAAPTHIVKEVLEITMFTKILNIADSLPEAFQQIARQ